MALDFVRTFKLWQLKLLDFLKGEKSNYEISLSTIRFLIVSKHVCVKWEGVDWQGYLSVILTIALYSARWYCCFLSPCLLFIRICELEFSTVNISTYFLFSIKQFSYI